METFEPGTFVRFTSDRYHQNYGRTIYGKVTGFIISKKYAARLRDDCYVLKNADGSKLNVLRGYINYAPSWYLEPDPFMEPARQAIKEAPSE